MALFASLKRSLIPARLRLVVGLALLGLCVPEAPGQLEPVRAIYGANRAIPVEVRSPEKTRAIPEIHLLDPATGEAIEAASVDLGRIDLASVFPVLWTTREPRLLLAQLVIEDRRVGPALVLDPIVDRARAVDGLTARLRRAVDRGDGEELRRLAALPRQEREALRRQVEMIPPETNIFSGLRVYKDQRLVLHTSAGDMTFALRPDKAPMTVFAFRELVATGFYTDVAFHRVIASDGRGRPFIVQAGDPTATGFGGAGILMDFEPSSLPHDFGVLSIARTPDDPNSNGSQFFICLSREACAPLDGLYTSFGQLVEGADVLETIARVPVGPRDPGTSSSAQDRPLDAPVIRSAELVDAPPYGAGPPDPARRVEQPPAR